MKCSDVENAKSAVNRFGLGLHEEGENDAYATVRALEFVDEVPPQLEITYEGGVPPPPPPVGYQYGDGLVFVQSG